VEEPHPMPAEMRQDTILTLKALPKSTLLSSLLPFVEAPLMRTSYTYFTLTTVWMVRMQQHKQNLPALASVSSFLRRTGAPGS